MWEYDRSRRWEEDENEENTEAGEKERVVEPGNRIDCAEAQCPPPLSPGTKPDHVLPDTKQTNACRHVESLQVRPELVGGEHLIFCNLKIKICGLSEASDQLTVLFNADTGSGV